MISYLTYWWITLWNIVPILVLPYSTCATLRLNPTAALHFLNRPEPYETCLHISSSPGSLHTANMDPLTALGLSASVAQFVSFASELMSKSKEIYTSTKGGTDSVLTLETVYNQLRDLSSSLESSSQKDLKFEAVRETSDFVKHVFAINDLSRSCKNDCDRLLEVLRRLQAGDGSKNRWQSFTLTLETVWRRHEIADLEQRLHHVQATLTLHICALTRCVSRAFSIVCRRS